MKDKPHCPQKVYSLPRSAKQWMDAYYARRRTEPDPYLKATYEEIDKLAVRLQLPDYSVKNFRNLHFLHHPNSSVAGIPINDDLFLILIEAGIYTIETLSEKLENGTISKLLATCNEEENIAALQQALKKWQTELIHPL